MNRAPQDIHRPVLPDVVLRMLSPLAVKMIVDGTLGLGGHSEALLQQDPTVRVIGLDQDPQAIALASQRLSSYGDRFRAIHGNTRDLNRYLDAAGEGLIDGLLLDLGVSSLQLDHPDRGFSFRRDGPLDMRMNPTDGPTASDWLNQADEEEIRHCLATYGEERFARQIARTLVRERAVRPIHSTGRLAEIIRQAVPRRYDHGRIDPATRTFQAIRIQINQELPSLEAALAEGFRRLHIGGVLVVISFHSLEDRIVKQFLRTQATDCVCPPELPDCLCDKIVEAKVLTPRPIRATPEEITANPRARSARLRAAVRIAAA